MQAVILAAGMGTRIKEFHALPKGFICLQNQSIIQESIKKLRDNGIYDILIVTGYRADVYEALAENEKNITTVFNPQFDKYGNLFSLYCANDFIKDDFLLLESDIIYEKKAIELVIHDEHPNVILLSGDTHSGDEVYVQACDKKLIRMSKQKDHLAQDQIYGEFVGINKISLRDFRQLIHQLEQDSKVLHFGYYDEQGLVAMTAFTEVYCLKEELLWCEIDNEFQFNLAKKLHEKINGEMMMINSH